MVSIVPSQTELLHYIGLEDEVIGITKFCIHPNEWWRKKTRVGGTKNIDLEAFRKLGPDLVLANKEENTKEQVEALAEFYDVYVSDVSNLDEAISMVMDIGLLTGKSVEANLLAAGIKSAFRNIKPAEGLKVAYLIWQDPYMVAAGGTFINHMLDVCGFTNVFKHLLRYPMVSLTQLQECDVVMLSSEPYPFGQKHLETIQGQLTNQRVLLVDGEMFSWYGSRLLQAPAYFSTLIASLQTK